MKIERIKLLRTLKAGTNVWLEGSVYPNDAQPSIPDELLREARLGVSHIEVIKASREERVKLPVRKEKTESTSTSVDVQTSNSTREALEKALQQEKISVVKAEAPVKAKKTRKRKLVTRK